MKVILVVLVLVACKGEPAGGQVDNKQPKQPVAVAVPPKPACDPKAGAQCAGENVVACGADGQLGNIVQTCKAGCKNGACVDTCAAKDIELVYVVDDASKLFSFDPKKLPDDPFREVGTLECGERSATPFSMAVDRRGVAWVLYNNGATHRVSILNAWCSRLGQPPAGNPPQIFGMGFVSDGPKSDTETLYVSDAVDKKTLATVDTAQEPPVFTKVATIAARQTVNPELTGTGDGKLFGFFPEPGEGFVSEIDRKTGQAIGSRHAVPAGTGEVQAYAFAHWGGVFYVFVTIDGNSMVHAINRKTGKHELVREHVSSKIVGAGVSTCAPLLERAP